MCDEDGIQPCSLAKAVAKGDIAELLGVIGKEDLSIHDTLLIDALKRKYYNIAALLISKGALVNCTSESGWTPLHLAAADPAAIEVLALLLDHGADVDAEITMNSYTNMLMEEAGDTPLHRACLAGNLEAVELLLKKGADLDQTNTHCTSPLIIAIQGQWAEMTKILLDNGADVHQYNISPPSLWCITPLDWAMSQLFDLLGPDNLYKIVHLFLSWERDEIAEAIRVIPEKVELEPPDFESLTNLLTIIGLLVSKGAKDNIVIQVMKFRSTDEAYKVAKILIEQGAKLDVEDQRGISLMQVAACVGYCDLIKLFLDNGADGDQPNHCGWTPLMISLAGFREIDINVVKLYVEYGADVNAVDDRGKTPLMIAIPGYVPSHEHYLIVEYLIRHGAQVNTADSDGDTPLSRALRFRKREDTYDIIKFLLESGAEVNTRNSEGITPLHMAISKPDRVGIDIIEMLLDYGADVDGRDTEGNTPLMLAITFSEKRVTELLIERGADINAHNNAGYCPLQIALSEMRSDILSQLLINKVKFDPMILLEDWLILRSVVENALLQKHEVIAIHQLPHRHLIITSRRALISRYIETFHSKKSHEFRGRVCLAMNALVRDSSVVFNYFAEIRTYSLLFKLLESRLLALKLEGEEVADEFLEFALSYRYKNEKSNNNLYIKECDAEIERLKEHKMTESMSLLELITMDCTRLAICARNDDIFRKLQDIYRKLNSDFNVPYPIFEYQIKERIQNALIRKQLLRTAEFSLNSLLLRYNECENHNFNVNSRDPSIPQKSCVSGGITLTRQVLPIVVSDAILSLLSDQDLKNLIAADCGITTRTIRKLLLEWKKMLPALVFRFS